MMIIDSAGDMSSAAPSDEAPKAGGRTLRKRETAACPLCFNTFYTGELEAHVSACLYFLEEASARKKHKKTKASTPLKATSTVTSTTTSASPRKKQRLSTPNPNSNVSPTNSTENSHAERASATDQAPKITQPTAAEWDITEAPIFRPTSEEFQHPLRYIASIRPLAEKAGICRIIPPYPCETWSKNIDPESFIFKTKVQNIHQLKTRWQGPNEVFVSGLCAFLDKRGTPLRSIPKVDGRDLDLFKLFVSVVQVGGMHETDRRNIWKDVVSDLKLPDTCSKANLLRQHYYKILYPYELYRKNKRQRQMAIEELDGVNIGKAVAADVQAECLNPSSAPELSTSIEETEDNEFGFYEGKYFILQKFEKMAHAFQKKWFPDVKRPDRHTVEREFWKIVDNADENVQVHYGSDLDVSTHSSGFPRGPPPPSSAITPALSHWNLNHLPRMEGSVLRHITGQISGVTDPMIYVGMLFSSFCWHTEDNYLYSINYLHKGACKTWYGVPASAAEHFESVMKEAVPELFMKHPDLLHLLITMISPALLLKHRVPVVRTVQEPGQYVITFPQAYHAGFSHGFTCAEAVNFAPADWLPFGALSVENYRLLQRGGVFSHEQLLCSIAHQDPSAETAFYLYNELKKVRDNEQKMRDALRLAGLTMQMTGNTSSILEGEPNQCKFCRYDCYLSSVACSCAPQYVACLHHAEQLCRCDMRKKVIQVRVPLNIIDDVISIVEKKKVQKPKLLAQVPTQQQRQPPTPTTTTTTTTTATTNHHNNTNKENSVHLSNKARSGSGSHTKKSFGGSGNAALPKTKEVIFIDITDEDLPDASPPPPPATATALPAVVKIEPHVKETSFASTGHLYQNHIPPAPSISAVPINYTPSSLSKIPLRR